MNEEFSVETENQTEGVLPSDEVVKPSMDDFIKSNTSDNGKLFGQFDDVTSALEHYRKQEITHTNNMRELKNAEKSKQDEIQSVQAELETTQKQQEVINSLLPEFINNNMTLTDEMIAQIKETGLDEKDIKLKAYEVRDNANSMKAKAYSVTGGDAEEYNNMIQWSADVLSEEDKAGFDKAIQGLAGNSDIGILAIEGLYNRYKNRDNAESNTFTPRIQGTSSKEVPSKGYTNFEDLSRDKRAAQANPALREQYLRKLSMTDNRVLGL